VAELPFPTWQRLEQPARPAWPAWARPDPGQLPHPLPDRLTLVNEPNGRVLVKDFDVYSHGFLFRLEARLPNLPVPPWAFRSADLMKQYGDVVDARMRRLDVTVEMDTMPSHSASRARFWPADPAVEPPAHPGLVLLRAGGGGIQGGSVDCRVLWVTTLPRGGVVRFGAEWPGLAPRPALVELPATAFTSAAAKVTSIW